MVVDCCAVSCSGVAAAAVVLLWELVHSVATLSSVSMVDLRHTRPVWAGSAVRIACRKNTNDTDSHQAG